MDDATILHNPGCTESRATLALQDARGIQPRIVDYLREPPTATELKENPGKLGIGARERMRKEEPENLGLRLDPEELDEDALIAAMRANQLLIKRPFVLANGKAAIGRPPEAILGIL